MKIPVLIDEDWVEDCKFYISESSGEQLFIDEQIIQDLQAAETAYDKAYNAFISAIMEARAKEEKRKALEAFFSKPHHSRMDKIRFLIDHDWEQVSTSTFRKDGKELPMHEAFEFEHEAFKSGL